MLIQGSKIALVRSYLRVPQAAGQVKILIFLVKFYFFLIYVNNFCDAGQVPILRYFEACYIMGCLHILKPKYQHYMGLEVRKPVFLVSEKAILKPISSAAETS